jgi:short-subunit dehydrogenase
MNETVLITGASSGIGLELAKCFAADKSGLVLVARNTAALETLAAELRARHQVKIHVITADLARPDAAQFVYDELKGRGTVVDVLVNNAGFGLHGGFAELPLARQLEIIQVNVVALVALTGLFLPGMIQRKSGGVLNVGSVAGFVPGPHMAVYCATKAFVQSFTEAVAEELPGAGVTVTAFCPGATDTNFGKVARGQKQRQHNVAKMPAEVAARSAHRDFRAGRIVSVPGFGNRLIIFLIRFMPRWLPRRLFKHYNRMDESGTVEKWQE